MREICRPAENPRQSRGPRLVSLIARDGVLVARLEDGTSHIVYPHVAGDEVSIGCVQTNKKALELIQEAIRKEEEFQESNCKRLMAESHRKKAKA